MDKKILAQYVDMIGEVKDLRQRVEADEKRLMKMQTEGIVADTVKGTRKDGTIGLIRIEGFAEPAYRRMKAAAKQRIEKLKALEAELSEIASQVDDFINEIPKSELRIMFRLYYIDDLTWEMVAMRMNYIFPKRKISYTKDSCRMLHNRYLQKN